MRNFLKLTSVLMPVLTLMLLPGCGGQFMSPPQAEIGDAALTVTVKLSSPGSMPAGANVAITLADVSGVVDSPLAGDTISISEGDRSIRVSLPADKNKISRCRNSGVCGVYVRITKGGTTLYRNANPAPYVTSQKNITVHVSGA